MKEADAAITKTRFISLANISILYVSCLYILCFNLFSSLIHGSLEPTKYHYAFFVGKLIHGIEGQGCHNFYPSCPFSSQDIQDTSRKVILQI